MPTPERTSLDAIVTAARELLEDGGPSRITMQAVAERVGVRAPSLYKRVRDRDALVALTATATADDLRSRLDAASASLEELARSYRTFAHAHPEGFRLLIGGPADPAALSRVGEPVVRLAAAAVGEERALDAARLITAWATGFLTMELAGAFRLGGDVDAAFDYGLSRLRASLSSSARAAHGS